MEEPQAIRARIVVVDSPDRYPNVAALLERRFGVDYDILREETGAAALDRLRALQRDGVDVCLILADQWTPDMTGVQLLRASIDAYPDARRGVLVGPGELRRAREEILQAAPWARSRRTSSAR